MSSQLSQFFQQKSILITGGSGFVGKCLLERILYCCREVQSVYLLLRPKSGETAEKRLKALLKTEVFDRIRLECCQQLAKVVAVCGDVTYDELGLSPIQRQVIVENVTIVFNCAATIRFDEPLRRALQLNVGSAQRLIRLVDKFQNIEALVHVSTAYCTRDKHDVLEEVPRELYSPQRLLDACEWMDDSMLEDLSKHLFRGRHSSYHFSKALAEQLFAESQLPLAIVRPSIIVGAFRDPFPGWTDNYNGISGYLVAKGKGILRTLLCEPDFLCDVIPVDIVCNNLLAAARHVTTERQTTPFVVNCVSGPLNGLTWRQIQTYSQKPLQSFPSMELFRAPNDSLHATQLVHWCHLLVEHVIPAFVVDLLFRACGLQPILGKVYEKLNRSTKALEFFTRNEWNFRFQNQKLLIQTMSSTDRQLFPNDVTAIDWKLFFQDFVLGIRRFLLKEEPKSIPSAQKRLKKYSKKEIKINPILIRFLFHS